MIQLIDPKRQAELEDEIVKLNLEVARQASANATLRNQYTTIERKILRLEEAFSGLRAKVSGDTYYGRTITPTDMSDLRDRDRYMSRPVSAFFDDSLPRRTTAERTPEGVMYTDYISGSTTVNPRSWVNPWSWVGPGDE